MKWLALAVVVAVAVGILVWRVGGYYQRQMQDGRDVIDQ